MKVPGNSIVRIFKICLWNLLKINKSGEFICLLTFGCLVSHSRKFAKGFWVYNQRLPLMRLPGVFRQAKNVADHFFFFINIFQEKVRLGSSCESSARLDISCELSARQTIHMKCWLIFWKKKITWNVNLFSVKKKKKIKSIVYCSCY